jgi:hypothetical protein
MERMAWEAKQPHEPYRLYTYIVHSGILAVIHPSPTLLLPSPPSPPIPSLTLAALDGDQVVGRKFLAIGRVLVLGLDVLENDALKCKGREGREGTGERRGWVCAEW